MEIDYGPHYSRFRARKINFIFVGVVHTTIKNIEQLFKKFYIKGASRLNFYKNVIKCDFCNLKLKIFLKKFLVKLNNL